MPQEDKEDIDENANVPSRGGYEDDPQESAGTERGLKFDPRSSKMNIGLSQQFNLNRYHQRLLGQRQATRLRKQ